MNILVGTDAGIHVGWHGTDDDTSGFPGFGPSGMAVLAFDLEQGFTQRWRWPTNIIKTRSGKEQRISRNDRVKESYSGVAVLVDGNAVAVRNELARRAAKASVFSLALPHEALLLSADASGNTVSVDASLLALTDWRNPGQRVVVVREDDDELVVVEAIIQDASGGSIVLDIDPGETGLEGGRIMPVMPVYLEPQQDFTRHPVDAEEWKINARAAVFDFAMTLHSLDLEPLTVSAGLEAATVTARTSGSTPYFRLVGDSADFGHSLEESSGSVVIHFYPGFTTAEDVYTLLQGSTLVNPTGIWGAVALEAGDTFALTQLSGGETQGPVGTGASVTTYADHPVWDRELRINGTITDGIHALTEIIDQDGLPYAIGLADQPDWYRGVAYSHDTRAEYQWLKLFMATVKGPQKAWWLSTWRDDLTFVSKATNEITVAGDVGAWYPAQRQHLQIWETNDTLTRVEITDAVDNGDGTYTLTIDATLASSSVQMVSWLELCRFERDEFEVVWDQHGFSMKTIARVVQQ